MGLLIEDVGKDLFTNNAIMYFYHLLTALSSPDLCHFASLTAESGTASTRLLIIPKALFYVGARSGTAGKTAYSY